MAQLCHAAPLAILTVAIVQEVEAICVTTPYVYLWEFVVDRDHAERFERAYGPVGEWVRLFRRGSGYIRSELYRDRANTGRYLTIDYWESEAAWQSFRSQFASEFTALDARCAQWTTTEREIGRFEPITHNDQHSARRE